MSNNINEKYYNNNELDFDNNEINYQEIIPNYHDLENEEYINFQTPVYFSKNNISNENYFNNRDVNEIFRTQQRQQNYSPSFNNSTYTYSFKNKNKVFIPKKDFINEPIRKVYAKNLSNNHFRKNDYFFLYNEKNKKAASVRMRDNLRESISSSEYQTKSMYNKRSSVKRKNDNSILRSYSPTNYKK